MKWLTFKKQRGPGFRLNITDILFIGFLISLSFMVHFLTDERGLYLLPLYIGATFFLFCNVFRIGNSIEPFWYIPFVGIFVYGFYTRDNFWPLVLLICEPLKLGLIIYRIRRGPYVGAFHHYLSRYSAQ